MKRIGLIIGLLAVVLFTSVTGLQALEDTTALCDKIQVIDAQLGRKLTPFKHYREFFQAVLKQEESGYQYEVYFFKNGIYGIDRMPITELQLHELCEEIALMDKYELSFAEARNRVIRSSVLYTAAFYSNFYWYLRTGFPDDLSILLYKPIITVGIGLMTYSVTKGQRITEGMASAYTFGTAMGLAHGMAFTDPSYFFDDEISLPQVLFLYPFPLTYMIGIAEGIGFSLLAKQRDYTWGYTSSVGSGGLWGSFSGYFVPHMFTKEPNYSLAGPSSLLFSAAGMVGGHYLYKTRGVTRGDVTTINSYGVLGSFLGYTINRAIAGETEKSNHSRGNGDTKVIIPYASGMFVGSLAGVGMGLLRTHKYHYTRYQGNMIALGEFAGGLVGLGIAVIGKSNKPWGYGITSMGATLGLIGSDLLLRRASSRSADFASNLQVQFNPMGLVNAFDPNPNLNTYQPWDSRYQNSLVNLSLTF